METSYKGRIRVIGGASTPETSLSDSLELEIAPRKNLDISVYSGKKKYRKS
jgi:hypothetical protein